MVLELEEVVKLCSYFTKDVWKLQLEEEYVFKADGLHIVSFIDDYLGYKEILASYQGNQFLWYREHYANSRYIYNPDFEKYIVSDDFSITYAKYLLCN